MKDLFELPKVTLPFLEDNRQFRIDRKELVVMMKFFSRDGRYPLKAGNMTNKYINQFLKDNPTLVTRIRNEILGSNNQYVHKKAA